MKDEDKKKLDEILLWIINNNQHTEAMDKIANAAYPYTAKYRDRYEN